MTDKRMIVRRVLWANNREKITLVDKLGEQEILDAHSHYRFNRLMSDTPLWGKFLSAYYDVENEILVIRYKEMEL